MDSIRSGFWSGILATGPMTFAMFRMQQALPKKERSPLPPATLTSHATHALNIDDKLSKGAHADLTMLAHFGYGASCGVAFALFQKLFRLPRVASGGVFGLLVWAFSYAGWIPVFNLRTAVQKMPPKRNAMMILSHIVWGASLGYAFKEMSHFGNEMLDGRRKAPAAE